MTQVTVGGKVYTFKTIAEALLFVWDRGPENIEKVVSDGKLIQLRETMWK